VEPAAVPHAPVGEAAALLCAMCWSLSAIFFTVASRRATASGVNQFRLVAALVLLAAVFGVQGALAGFESAPPPRQTLLLAASGVVGLTLGDAALFRAFVILGTRRVMLLSALAPVFVAVLAAAFLGERIGPAGVAGMVLTLTGVGWVLLGRSGGDEVRGSLVEGVTLGVLAALGQGAGAVLTKAGLGQAGAATSLGAFISCGDGARAVSPLLGTLLRIAVGCAAFLAFTVPTGRFRHALAVAGDRRALGFTLAGTLVGPVVGIWLSLVAFARTEVAVAQTILGLTPVLVLPASRLVTGERAPARAYAGALLAVAGAMVLAYRGAIEAALRASDSPPAAGTSTR
jgi:drug/metabolite transporter (DMT)-like permease